MGVKYTYSCDGCDSAAPTSDTADAPASWKHMKVEINEVRAVPNRGATYVLCPRCIRTLRENANPTKWPRTDFAR